MKMEMHFGVKMVLQIEGGNRVQPTEEQLRLAFYDFIRESFGSELRGLIVYVPEPEVDYDGWSPELFSD